MARAHQSPCGPCGYAATEPGAVAAGELMSPVGFWEKEQTCFEKFVGARVDPLWGERRAAYAGTSVLFFS